jgi:hypothetical protein
LFEHKLSLNVFWTALLIGIAGWIIYSHADVPRSRDAAVYSVIAHQLLEKKLPYSDFWDHKPPAIYLALALSEVIAGRGDASVLFLSFICICFSILGMIRLFALVQFKRGFSNALGAVFILLSLSPRFDGSELNLESLINPLLIWGTVALLETPECVALSALFFGLALWVKQVALFPIIGIYAALLITKKNSVRKSFLPFVIGALLWAVTFFYYYLGNNFSAAWEALMTYNRHYVDATGEIKFPHLQIPLKPLYLISLLGGVFAVIRLRSRSSLAIVGYMLGAVAAVMITGRYYLHYFQLLLPPVVLLIGYLGSSLQSLKYTAGKFSGLIVICVVLGLIVFNDRWIYRYTPLQFSRLISGPRNQGIKDLGITLKDSLSADTTFYEWGADPALYYYSQKTPPSRFFYSAPLIEGPLAGKFTSELVSDLKNRMPDYIFVDSAVGADLSTAKPFFDFLLTSYAPEEKLFQNQFLAVFKKKS